MPVLGGCTVGADAQLAAWQIRIDMLQNEVKRLRAAVAEGAGMKHLAAMLGKADEDTAIGTFEANLKYAALSPMCWRGCSFWNISKAHQQVEQLQADLESTRSAAQHLSALDTVCSSWRLCWLVVLLNRLPADYPS